MIKGNYGLNLAAIAIVAFILGFFSLEVALLLVVAYAVLIEKDRWLTRQSLQALFLLMAYRIAGTVLNWAFNLINGFFGWFDAIRVMSVFNNIGNAIDLILYVIFLLLTILAIFKLMKNQDAGLPIVGDLANYAMGMAAPKPAPVPAPQYAAPTAPVYQQPVPPAAPVYQQPVPPPPAAPVAVPETAAAPATAPGSWLCSCGRENTGNFCMNCGNPRQS